MRFTFVYLIFCQRISRIIWINTSRHNHIFGNHFDSFKTKVSIIRSESLKERESKVTEIREEFATLCSEAFTSLSNNQILELIIDAISDGIDYVFVNDQENEVLYQFDPENHPAIELAKTCDSVELVTSKRAKSSRKVIFIKDGVRYDYGIRLRVTSNNGITAFLGLSKANKN